MQEQSEKIAHLRVLHTTLHRIETILAQPIDRLRVDLVIPLLPRIAKREIQLAKL